MIALPRLRSAYRLISTVKNVDLDSGILTFVFPGTKAISVLYNDDLMLCPLFLSKFLNASFTVE